MSTIHCLIVDDEPPAVDLLLNYTGMIDQLEVVGTSHSAIKAFDMLKDTHVDLMFLDIQMPVLNGIDFIKSLKNPPAIILTTAYREYALDSYNFDIIDYLLKPIAFDRFLKAVDRFRDRKLTTLTEAVNTENKSDHIYLNVNKTHHKVFFSDILYVESLKDYVRVHTVNDRLVVKGNLGSMMKKLPSHLFVRIHRSYAIALGHINSYNQSEVDINGIKLPIGISFRDEFGRNILK